MMTICNKAHDMSTKLLMPGDECKERSKKGVAVLIQRQGMMEDKIKEPQSDCINALRVQEGHSDMIALLQTLASQRDRYMYMYINHSCCDKP